jgi:hypothetical protein
MGDSGGTLIVIKGGSVSLVFDENIYPKDPADPMVHGNRRLKITRVVIQSMGGANYDSGEFPEGLMASIIIECR